MARNPFEDLETAIERVSEQFEDGLDLAPNEGVPVDVLDRGDEYVVVADLPGFDADDVDVTLSDGRLDVTAERDEAVVETGADETTRYVRRERAGRSVSRSVRLPEPVDADAVTATHSDGVLTVTLPKEREDGDGHTIEVQ
jgi:HSP20 family protein